MTSSKVIKIDEIEYVRKDSIEKDKVAVNTDGMPYVVARCKDAGVHAGYLSEVDKSSRYCVLLNSRRLWRWNSPDNTLSGLANKGFYSSQECKVGDVVSRIQLSEYCELIDCTVKAKDIIEGCSNWNFGGSK